MDSNEANAIETKKLNFRPERFISQKMYRETDLTQILNPEKLNAFVSEALIGERKLWFYSTKDKKVKYSQKVVGTDFEKRVFETNRDALVLIHHPVSAKNRGLKAKFEAFAREQKQEMEQ
jgi:hypothetical protein